MKREGPLKYRNKLLIILGALAVLRILYIIYSPFDLSPDEAHYWEWSRRLDLSYYSKGPGVAYVIAFFTAIFGDTEFGVRIGAVVFSTLASYGVYIIGKELFGSEKVGFYSALTVNITPIFAAGSILMTTDVLFIFFWIVSVYTAKKALETGSARFWYLTGASVGLGFLCKYTMLLIYPSLFLMLLVSKKERPWLKRKEPYITGLISLVVSTPVILWNLKNGQVTIKHTMGQAHIGSGALSLKDFFEFFGSQVGLITPILFFTALFGLWQCFKKGLKEERSELLLAFFASVPLLLFFQAVALHGKVQANWAIAGYATAIPAAVWAFFNAYDSGRNRGRVKALSGISVALCLILSFFVYFPWYLEPVAKRIITGPPYNRVTGWKDLGEKVTNAKAEVEASGKTFVISETYQMAGEIALYTGGNPVVYNVDTGTRRMNQYDLWPGYEDLIGYNAVYVKGGIAELEERVSGGFDRCDREVFDVYWEEKVIKNFTIFRCYGFKGIEGHGKEMTY